MRLTKRIIEALEPQEAEYFIWDDAMSGFGLRVHPTGRKVFLLRYRTTSGTQRKLTIGNAATMGHRNLMTTARYIHDGIDPHDVSNKASAVMLGQQIH